MGVFAVSLSLVVLDVQEDLDNIIGNSLEGLITDSGADNSDSFNDLSAELSYPRNYLYSIVFRLAEFGKELREHLESLIEVGYEGFFGLLSAGGESSSSVLLEHGHTVLDEQEELLADGGAVR